MVTGRPVTNNGFGFLPGRAPEAAPYRHMPLSRGCLSGLARRDIFFFPSPVLVPPISWLLLSESQPGLCLGVQLSGAGIPVSARLPPAPLPPGTRLGSRSLGVLAADRPRQQGGGPYSDAPRHVPHSEWEPPEAAHHEGVGAPRPGPCPPHPELAGDEWTGLTDPLLCFCPQSQGHEEQAGHL